MKTIVFLSGLTGAGKSTLASGLGRKVGLPVFSVGNFQRDYARSLGYENVVEFNRKFGLKVAYFDLLPRIAGKIIKVLRRKNGIIVEGFYSKELEWKIMSEIPSAKVIFVNIGASRHSRVNRVVIRDKISKAEAKKRVRALDSSKKKIGVDEVLIESRKKGVVFRNVFPKQAALNQLSSLIRRRLK